MTVVINEIGTDKRKQWKYEVYKRFVFRNIKTSLKSFIIFVVHHLAMRKSGQKYYYTLSVKQKYPAKLLCVCFTPLREYQYIIDHQRLSEIYSDFILHWTITFVWREKEIIIRSPNVCVPVWQHAFLRRWQWRPPYT